MNYLDTARSESDTSLSLYELLAITATVLAPFTSLRFSFFGLSEILYISLCGLVIFKLRFRMNLKKTSFCIPFFIMMVWSLLGWNYSNLTEIANTSFNSAIFNLCSWVLGFMVILISENLAFNDYESYRPEIILRYIFIILSIISMFLFLVSLSRDNLYGIRLKYHSYFCPMSKNIHQYAMLAVTMPFIGLHACAHEHKPLKRAFFFISSLAMAYIATQTGSSKASFGIIIGTIIVIMGIVNKYVMPKGHMRAQVILFIGGIVFLLLVVFNERIVEFLVELFSASDNGGARNRIYANSYNLIKESLIFGYGPSALQVGSSESTVDAHQTVLAAGMAAGVVGIIMVLLILYRGIKMTRRDYFYLAAMSTIVIYALGGDILRKASVWFVFVMLSYASKYQELDSVDYGDDY